MTGTAATATLVEYRKGLLELLHHQGAQLSVVESAFTAQFKPDAFPLVVAALRGMWDDVHYAGAELAALPELLIGYFLLSVVAAAASGSDEAAKAAMHLQLHRAEVHLRDGASVAEAHKYKGSSRPAAGGTGAAHDGALLDMERAALLQKVFLLRCATGRVDKAATINQFLGAKAADIDAEVAGWAAQGGSRILNAVADRRSAAQAEREAASYGGTACRGAPAPNKSAVAAGTAKIAGGSGGSSSVAAGTAGDSAAGGTGSASSFSDVPALRGLLVPHMSRPLPGAPPVTANELRAAAAPRFVGAMVCDAVAHSAGWRAAHELVAQAAVRELTAAEAQRLQAAVAAAPLDHVGLAPPAFVAMATLNPQCAAAVVQAMPTPGPMVDALVADPKSVRQAAVLLAAAPRMTRGQIRAAQSSAVLAVRLEPEEERVALVGRLAAAVHQALEKMPKAERPAEHQPLFVSLLREFKAAPDVAALWGSVLR